MNKVVNTFFKSSQLKEGLGGNMIILPQFSYILVCKEIKVTFFSSSTSKVLNKDSMLTNYVFSLFPAFLRSSPWKVSRLSFSKTLWVVLLDWEEDEEEGLWPLYELKLRCNLLEYFYYPSIHSPFQKTL